MVWIWPCFATAFFDGCRMSIKIRELNDAEIGAVAGGNWYATAAKGAAEEMGPHDDGKLPTLPCDSWDLICRIFT
jgi:hypothetical protein